MVRIPHPRTPQETLPCTYVLYITRYNCRSKHKNQAKYWNLKNVRLTPDEIFRVVYAGLVPCSSAGKLKPCFSQLEKLVTSMVFLVMFWRFHYFEYKWCIYCSAKFLWTVLIIVYGRHQMSSMSWGCGYCLILMFRRAVPEFCYIEEPIRTQRITVGRPPSR